MEYEAIEPSPLSTKQYRVVKITMVKNGWERVLRIVTLKETTFCCPAVWILCCLSKSGATVKGMWSPPCCDCLLCRKPQASSVMKSEHTLLRLVLPVTVAGEYLSKVPVSRSVSDGSAHGVCACVPARAYASMCVCIGLYVCEPGERWANKKNKMHVCLCVSLHLYVGTAQHILFLVHKYFDRLGSLTDWIQQGCQTYSGLKM